MATYTQDDIEREVETVLEGIRANVRAESGVPRQATVDFYEAIIESLRDDITTIKSEMHREPA